MIRGCRGDETYMFAKTVAAGDTILGRSKNSLVPLVTRYASRSHLKISLAQDNRCKLECQGSVNGTFLNDKKMAPKEAVLVQDKDVVRIGLETDPKNCFSFTFHCEPVANKENQGAEQNQVADENEAAAEASDAKLDQDVVVVLEQLPAERVKQLLAAASDDVVLIDSDHSDSPPPRRSRPAAANNLTSRPQNRKPAATMSSASSHNHNNNNNNNKRKLSPASPAHVTQEKRLKAAAALRKKTASTTSTTSTLSTKSNAAPSKSSPRKVRDALSALTPRKVVDVVSDIIGPAPKPAAVSIEEQKRKSFNKKYAEFMKANRQKKPPAAPIPQKQKPILINPAPLHTGSRAGYATAGARLPNRPASPPRSFSPDRESTPEPAAPFRQRVAHAAGDPRTAPLRPAATTTTASLLMKTPAPGTNEPAGRPVPQRPLVARPKVDVDRYLSDILNWNANWFKEANRITDEPIVTGMPLMPLKTSYESHQEYADTHIPYVLYEIWANLVEAYHKNSNTGLAQSESFSAHVTSYEGCGCFIRLRVEWPVRVHVRQPVEGDMVLMDVATEDCYQHNGAPIKYIGLGFVCEATCETRFNIQDKPYPVPVGCNKILHLAIFMKKQHIRINQSKALTILRLDYIRPQLKHIEAVLMLKHSKLLTDVLKPRLMTCQIPFPRDDNLGNREYNKSQHEAILGSAEGVKRGRALAKVLMIQGPPGTGKTHTLVGIVKEIYNTWHPWNTHNLPKILVCAPSNGAVDEIGKRLYHVRNFLKLKDKNRSLRCVRMGQDEAVKSECQHMTLEKLVEANMKNGVVDEEKIRELEEEMAKMDIEISNYRNRNKFEEANKVEKRIEEKAKEVDRLRKTKELSGTGKQQERAMRDDILKKADIILTTLNSCRTSYLDSMFNMGVNQFDCVIIDEASQCSEPELLMPLCYMSITKVILIGDPMQLPATVKSKKAQDAGFGTSLFERLFKFFGGYNEQTPVHTLNTQFRMHYDICKFPSAAFYDNRLLTEPGSGTDRRFPLKPYTVFDIKGTSHSSDDPKNIFNAGEAAFIIKLCILLNRVLSQEKSVGIITPYRGQMRMIKDKLQNARNFTVKIDVNTIDGFQGQERDVIIFSSVRSSEGLGGGVGFLASAQRMNVALTRAKFALIVCLSKKSLECSAIWKRLITDAAERGHLKEIGHNATAEAIQPLLVHPDAQVLRS